MAEKKFANIPAEPKRIPAMSKTRFEAHNEFEDLAKAIGRYIISFETVQHTIKNGIKFMLERYDLYNEKVFDVLIADMTADPLFKRYDGLFAVTFTKQLKDKVVLKKMDKIYKSIDEAIKYRNKLAYTHWFLTFTLNRTTYQEFKYKLHSKSVRIKRHSGAEENFPNVSFEFITTLNEKIKQNYDLARELMQLNFNIKYKKPLLEQSLDNDKLLR